MNVFTLVNLCLIMLNLSCGGTKRLWQNMDKLEELRGLIAFSIQENLELEVKSVDVTPFVNDEGDEILRVELTIALVKRRLPRDIMYDLVKSAAGAIRNSGESRFPVILPYLAEKQLLAARN